ncbi:NAD-dependent epimerase/dehydratase family protein [Amorphoplanes nipponensis]|uniref:Reductase n=1 Tax=Actinoplanes nipponensis TaxID=135950 RepID=A0A919JB19_9ACTN|nr:NAD(P)-dependent oxidoreductase [Actinoplanes nipponensis]GIE47383.1 reductase [Actinoplanes nipponensis]
MSPHRPDPARPVVVLGGNGFVGRHTCAAFAATGAPVVAVSRRPARLPGARSVALDLAAGDVPRLIGMLTAMRPFAVVNAAGAVWGVTEEELKASNVTLVHNLVEAVTALPWRPRLVHLGSVHEYGAVGCPIREDAQPRPISPYGHSKLAGAGAVLAAVGAGACDATVLRVVNVSGPGTPRASLLGQVADQLAAARRERRTALLRLAPLHARRDFVDVRDIAAAVRATALTPGAGPVINIGRGQAVSVRWLVRELITASGVPAEIVEHEDRATGEERGRGIDSQEIDTTRAREQLGWQARHALGESLAALWAHVRDRA